MVVTETTVPAATSGGVVTIPTRVLVFGMAHDDGTIHVDEVLPVAEACGQSAEQVRSCLRRLVTEGLFTRAGSGRDAVYAATEGGGTVIGAKEWMERPGSVGAAWPGGEIRIYDDDANLLPAGHIGTVYMALMADFEYKGDAAKTKANRIENFFTVGDLGELDADGYLFLRDRKSDMIISGGVNIYPAEIEGELINHPKVADVAVFGIPNADWGEEVKAVVQLQPGEGASDDTAAEILDWAAPRMAKFKLPRTVDFTETLPREPNGKLIKRKLRDPYWADTATQI